MRRGSSRQALQSRYSLTIVRYRSCRCPPPRRSPGPSGPSRPDGGWSGRPTTSSVPTATSAPRSVPSPRRPAWRCRPSTTRSAPRPLCSTSRSARRSAASTGGQCPRPEPVEITELLPWHGWWAEFEAASTSAAALDIFVTHGVGILQRVGPLITAMHGATGDADAARWSRRPRNAASTPTARWCGSSPASPEGCVAESPRPRGPTWWSCCSAPSSTSRSPSAGAGPTQDASSSSGRS